MCQYLMQIGVNFMTTNPSRVRPPLAFFNNCADMDALIAALTRLTSHRNTIPITGY
jgi:hypothetical protein